MEGGGGSASWEAWKSCLFCLGKSLQMPHVPPSAPEPPSLPSQGKAPLGSASPSCKRWCHDGSGCISIIFHVQHVVGSGGKAKGCGRKRCAGRKRAVVMLSDSFQLHGHLPRWGCSRGRLRPGCSSPPGGVPARAGGVEQTLMRLHTGGGKPKAAGETSPGKCVLFTKDVIYVSPRRGTRHFCWRGQAEAAGSPGWAVLPAAMGTGCHTGSALPGDRLLRCSQFVFSMAEPEDGLPAVSGLRGMLWGRGCGGCAVAAENMT